MKIARIAGTEIRIHFTFLLFLIWIGFGQYLEGGPGGAAEGILFTSLVFVCVVLHELGHVFAAKRYGIQTPDITLLPIGGVARLQRMPEEPIHEMVVALAGPAVNVVIGLTLFLAIGTDSLFSALNPDAGGSTLAARLLVVNVVLVLFNLLPAFPMDGGRVLRAALAMHMTYGQATRIAARLGQAFAIVFGVAGLFLNPLLMLVALFLFLAASQEASVATVREISSNFFVGDAMETALTTLSVGDSLGYAARVLIRTPQHAFPIIDLNGRVAGMLLREELVRSLRERGARALTGDVMRRQFPSIRQDAPFADALRRMQESGSSALAVFDAWGRLTGMVTSQGIRELLAIHAAAPETLIRPRPAISA
jgi:stage IV sporulation protein FB